MTTPNSRITVDVTNDLPVPTDDNCGQEMSLLQYAMQTVLKDYTFSSNATHIEIGAVYSDRRQLVQSFAEYPLQANTAAFSFYNTFVNSCLKLNQPMEEWDSYCYEDANLCYDGPDDQQPNSDRSTDRVDSSVLAHPALFVNLIAIAFRILIQAKLMSPNALLADDAVEKLSNATAKLWLTMSTIVDKVDNVSPSPPITTPIKSTPTPMSIPAITTTPAPSENTNTNSIKPTKAFEPPTPSPHVAKSPVSQTVQPKQVLTSSSSSSSSKATSSPVLKLNSSSEPQQQQVLPQPNNKKTQPKSNMKSPSSSESSDGDDDSFCSEVVESLEEDNNAGSAQSSGSQDDDNSNNHHDPDDSHNNGDNSSGGCQSASDEVDMSGDNGVESKKKTSEPVTKRKSKGQSLPNPTLFIKMEHTQTLRLSAGMKLAEASEHIDIQHVGYSVTLDEPYIQDSQSDSYTGSFVLGTSGKSRWYYAARVITTSAVGKVNPARLVVIKPTILKKLGLFYPIFQGKGRMNAIQRASAENTMIAVISAPQTAKLSYDYKKKSSGKKDKIKSCEGEISFPCYPENALPPPYKNKNEPYSLTKNVVPVKSLKHVIVDTIVINKTLRPKTTKHSIAGKLTVLEEATPAKTSSKNRKSVSDRKPKEDINPKVKSGSNGSKNVSSSSTTAKSRDIPTTKSTKPTTTSTTSTTPTPSTPSAPTTSVIKKTDHGSHSQQSSAHATKNTPNSNNNSQHLSKKKDSSIMTPASTTLKRTKEQAHLDDRAPSSKKPKHKSTKPTEDSLSKMNNTGTSVTGKSAKFVGFGPKKNVSS